MEEEVIEGVVVGFFKYYVRVGFYGVVGEEFVFGFVYFVGVIRGFLVVDFVVEI